MSGETPLILQDLRKGLSVKEVSKKYSKSVANIRAIARRYHVEFRRPLLTEEERKRKKRDADAQRRTSKKEFLFKQNRPDISLPAVPFEAARMSGLAKCNDAWAKRVGCRRLTENRAGKENAEINARYGLRFAVHKDWY